ncbi:MAG: dihydrolipoyllysine-residue acetyltransferase [Parvularcula sp.]|nr:dihydrolipoyllysine-residue acetyltransferase [Parvularcula sp.]
MAQQTITLPDIGDFESVPVAELLVSPGDHIAIDDPLIMIESDKASMEVPAPLAGEVKEILVSVGETISKGAPILVIEADAEAGGRSEPSLNGTAKNEAPEVAVEKSAPSFACENQQMGPQPAAQEIPFATLEMTHASPSVRAFARELGVDLSEVTASGPKGRILREDVSRVVKSTMTKSTAALGGHAGTGLLPWPKVDFEKYGEIERVSLTRIQKVSGANLARNWAVIPHVTNFDEADITDLEAFRKLANEERASEDVKITMVAFLIKASAIALKTFPRFNTSLDGDELVSKKYIHIGFAADTPNGLVVPVIRDCDKKGLVDITRDVSALAEKAREGSLSPSEMQGGCFSISSLGGIGGTNFTPIINAPEVAILGATRSAMKPVWDGKAFQPRLIQPLSLSWDHRVIDGVAAAHFLKKICDVLANVRRAAL